MLGQLLTAGFTDSAVIFCLGSGPLRETTNKYFCPFLFSLIFQEILFGRNFNKLQWNTLVLHKKNKNVVMHFHSTKLLYKIFSVRDTCMVYVLKDQERYWACPKVFLSNSTFGYVVYDDLEGQRLQVNTQNNVVIYINCSFSASPIAVVTRDEIILPCCLKVETKMSRTEIEDRPVVGFLRAWR